MEMKKMLISICALLTTAFACNKGPAIGQDDIVGRWRNPDGASFSFTKDGRFSGALLPAKYFTFSTSSDETEGRKIEGVGHWKLTKGKQFTEVKLSFDTINQQPILGLYTLFIAGNKGFLENLPPWHLFIWEDEVGGERYKFIKE
jgi:hypothetical protein